jgi:hypothetical protein
MKKENIIALLPTVLPILSGMIFNYWTAILTFTPAVTIRPLIFLLFMSGVIAWMTNKLLKNWHHTGIFLMIFNAVTHIPAKFLLPIAAVAVICFFVYFLISRLLKRKIGEVQVTYASLAYNVFIFALVFFQFAVALHSVDWAKYNKSLTENRKNPPVSTVDIKNKPDIYYIVLDAYGGSEILQKYYQYDNSEIVEHLTEKGFIVPPNATSAYSYTSLSVPTTLNMDYILDTTSGIEESSFWWLMKPYVQESKVQQFLKTQGYQSVAVESGFYITNNKNADIYLSQHAFRLNEFESYLFNFTPLKIYSPITNLFASGGNYDAHRKLIQYNFNTLSEIPNIPGPKFVFAHIITPHPPFVFDAHGNPLTPEYNYSFADGISFPGTEDEYRIGYIGQLQYTNSLIKGMVDAILEHSEIPPIIIIQADHGPRMLEDTRFPINACPNERFSIFAAYHLPGIDRGTFQEELTSVNIFRIIFNEYFFTDMELLDKAAYLPRIDRFKIFQTEYIDLNQQIDCTTSP